VHASRADAEISAIAQFARVLGNHRKFHLARSLYVHRPRLPTCMTHIRIRASLVGNIPCMSKTPHRPDRFSSRLLPPHGRSQRHCCISRSCLRRTDKPSNRAPGWSHSEFHPRSALTGKSRVFKFKIANKSEQDAAKRALDNPISQFSVNASLTLRMAMRRLLKIDGGKS
jgi:hypothetical protein